MLTVISEGRLEAMVFGRKKKQKELTQLHLEQYRQTSAQPRPAAAWTPPERPGNVPGGRTAETDLNAFIAELRPNEHFTFGESDIRRHQLAAQLASRPLTAYLEDQAAVVARLTMEAHRAGGHRNEELRAIGQTLGLQGGAFLMVLVALRAPYTLDPDWKAKRDEQVRRAREAGASVRTSAGGMVVRLLEYQWSGICGWQT